MKLPDPAAQTLHAGLDLDHITRVNRSPESDPLDSSEEWNAPSVLRLRQDQDRPDLRDAFGQNRWWQGRLFTRLMCEISFVERHILDPDNPFVWLKLGDTIYEQEWVTMGQDVLDGRVIQGQAQGIHDEPSIIRLPADCRIARIRDE
jgi:hypothetical protein